jgi:hypothetical protein
MVYSLWCMSVWQGVYSEYGVWCMVYGVWCIVYGVWSMVYGVWFMAEILDRCIEAV